MIECKVPILDPVRSGCLRRTLEAAYGDSDKWKRSFKKECILATILLQILSIGDSRVVGCV